MNFLQKKLPCAGKNFLKKFTGKKTNSGPSFNIHCNAVYEGDKFFAVTEWAAVSFIENGLVSDQADRYGPTEILVCTTIIHDLDLPRHSRVLSALQYERAVNLNEKKIWICSQVYRPDGFASGSQ
jgi:hypothetical protein